MHDTKMKWSGLQMKCFQQKKSWKVISQSRVWFVATRGNLIWKFYQVLRQSTMEWRLEWLLINFWRWDLKIKLFADTLMSLKLMTIMLSRRQCYAMNTHKKAMCYECSRRGKRSLLTAQAFGVLSSISFTMINAIKSQTSGSIYTNMQNKIISEGYLA